MTGRLQVQPITFREAVLFTRLHHRHHDPPQGHKYSIGVNNGHEVVGVVIVGRPVARMLDDGMTLEVTRLCTDGTRNACSVLYASAWRAARALGYDRLITYTGSHESGASLRGAGWTLVGTTSGGEWNCPARPRRSVRNPGMKTLWEAPRS